MIQYTLDDILNFEKRFRTYFVNSLSGFKSANLIGTINLEGLTNVAIFTSVVHIGANPPLMGFISRPNSVPRHTLENIRATEYYTINSVATSFIAQAHQTAARYQISEFEATGLTPEYISNFNAPFAKEAQLKIGLKVEDIIPIKVNNTLLVIGKVQQVNLPQSMILKDGKLNFETIETAAITGLDTYHKTEQISRFSYAKPNKSLSNL